MLVNKEVAELIRQIRSWPGWRIEERRKGYLVFPPDPEARAISIHKTPSDRRWRKNTVASLRRAGAPI